jgi:hypothetical protein
VHKRKGRSNKEMTVGSQSVQPKDPAKADSVKKRMQTGHMKQRVKLVDNMPAYKIAVLG